MDQLTAFVHGSFNVSSVHILESCFASEVALVQTMANGALDTTVQTAESAPWQVFSGVTLACALGLLFLGWYLVRAVNFFGGLYIGASLSLFVLSLAATGTPLVRPAYGSAQESACASAPELAPSLRRLEWALPGFWQAANCIAMLSIVSGSALLIAIICVVKRKSMYLLLGLIAGEIIGKFVYHLALEHSEFFDFGTNTLYVSVGFFAVLGAYAVKEIGDLAWMICTALMGAYFATTALVELVGRASAAKPLICAPRPGLRPAHCPTHTAAGCRPVRSRWRLLWSLPRLPADAHHQRRGWRGR